MTIRLLSNHRLKPLFERHHVAWLSEDAAERQDIRPLRIGILNIMPQAEEYEYNLLAPMGRSILQIDPVWIRLQNHAYRSSDRRHLDTNYLPYDWATALGTLDGLILTGAPVEQMEWADITYWEELLRIFRAKGCPAARVITGLTDAFIPARKAYQKAGFDRKIESVTYYLDLNAPEA